MSSLQNSDKHRLPGTPFYFALPDSFPWEDSAWVTYRSRHQGQNHPLNIYEVHLGSWRRTGDGQFLTCREIAQFLIPYVKDLGFTHVELFSVGDHLIGQPPTSPADLMYLINELHRAGIGVLFDWDCRCVPEDTPQDTSSLIVSALFLLENYHIDGLHLNNSYDSLISTDPEFLRALHEATLVAHPGVLIISSTAAEAPEFSLSWGSDWTHRILQYVQLDPYFRQFNHDKITASLPSTPATQGILPLSHHEIVHNKGSLLNKMPGSDREKFSGVRALYTYAMTHPGKKLTVMGCEFGQWDEWHCDRSLDWHLLEQQDEDGLRHRQLHTFFKAINDFYLKSPALWQQDFSSEGFRWVCSDDSSHNIVAFLRFDQKGNSLLCIVNFSPMLWEHYQIGIPQPGLYEEIFSSDRAEFGGEHRLNQLIKSEYFPCHGMPHSLQINLPPLSAIILQRVGTVPTKTILSR